MPIGDCPLCLGKGLELQDSHILPKWTYRRAFDKDRTNGSPHPIMVRGGVAVQTSEQISEYMLCWPCEQQLGRDEDYVSRLAYREGGTLGFIDALPVGSIRSSYAEDLRMHVRAASIATLDCQAIARFAASVFWRAHVARRPKVQALRLWNPQAEALRRFIRGEAMLPARMCINVIAIVDEDAMTSVHATTTTLPSSGPKGDDSFHQFVAAGLLFNLGTGGRDTGPLRCVFPKTPAPVATGLARRIKFVFETAVTTVSAPRVGRLARPPR